MLNPDISSNGQLLHQAPLHIAATTLPDHLQAIDLSHITYASAGLRLHGVLAHPRAPGPYPCIIYNRGGYGPDSALTSADTALHLAPMAAWGYVVIASHYRGNLGSDGADEFCGDDLHDVLNLIPCLEHIPAADPARIGMWGWSRGGLMTYRALAHTNRITAAIIVAGIADAFDYVQRRPDIEQDVFAPAIPHYNEQREAALTLRSPIRWPERLCPHTPLLLLHGSADWRIHPTQTLRMATTLLAHQHPFRLVIFEGGDHALSEHQADYLTLARSWLDRYVRDQQRWPPIAPHGV